jgi:phenylacetate-coenzyme A ligase PaaK-like adenylate-forming protein
MPEHSRASLSESVQRQIAIQLFRLHELAKGHATFRVLREMQTAQWLPPENLLKIQNERLQRFLAHAVETVPYYKNHFRELRLDVSDIRRVADLPLIPCLRKRDIRENLELMKSRHAGKLQRFATGGSTGEPLIFYLGATRVSSDVAARMRAEGWFGVGIGDREFAIWGSPLELSKQDTLRGLRDRILRTRLMPAFEMSPAVMTRYLDEICRLGCRRIFGYPSSIARLCNHARQEGRDLRGLGVRVVFVTSEYLEEEWRHTIAETFGCPVANGYGGRDSGFVAHECPAGGMHITADRIIVEIVDDKGRPLPAGQAGEIVVTNLDTPEMPFIRYCTGDIGALAAGQCGCGRTLPLLERIEGRKTDFIVAPDGRVLHGLSVIYVVREITGIAAFRITQRRITEFELEIVPGPDYDPHCESRIRDGFSKRLRAPVSVNIVYRGAIAPTASGKVRHVVSEVALPETALYG